MTLKDQKTKGWKLIQTYRVWLLSKAYKRCSLCIANYMTRRQLLVNLFFILIVLLSYNSSTTKLTLLKCTIKWIFVQYLWNYATVTVGNIYHPKKNLYTYQQSLPWSPPLAPWEPLIYFLYLQNWLFCIGGIIHYVFFCDWVVSIMFSKFILVVACIRTLFLLIAK